MGLMAGVTLALQGLPLSVTVALSLGGFLAGMGADDRAADGAVRTVCAGNGRNAGVHGNNRVGSLGARLLLLRLSWRAAAGGRRISPPANAAVSPLPDAPGDAYAAYALRRWEKTVGDMARAVPSPVGLGEKRTPQWWEEHLCASCPERASCGCMNTELGQSRAEYIWKAHEASDEVWAQRLESLRGLGCATAVSADGQHESAAR